MFLYIFVKNYKIIKINYEDENSEFFLILKLRIIVFQDRVFGFSGILFCGKHWKVRSKILYII